MTLTFGTDRYNNTALFCGSSCAIADGYAKIDRVPVSICLDEDNEDYWEYHEDGCSTPIYGHTCGYCSALIWDDEDIP